MSASEHEHIGIVRLLGEGLRQVDSGDLLGNSVLNPSFFDQRHKQGTGLLPDRDSFVLQRSLISMPADGRIVANTATPLLSVSETGGFGPGSMTPITPTCEAAL